MPSVASHSANLAADKRTVRIEIARNGKVLWYDLTPEGVDLLIDGLREMREQMVEDPFESSN